MRMRCFCFCCGFAFGVWMYVGIVFYPQWYNQSIFAYSKDDQSDQFGSNSSSDWTNLRNETFFIVCVVIIVTNDAAYLEAIDQTYSRRCDQLIFYGSTGRVDKFPVVVIQKAPEGTWAFFVALFNDVVNRIKAPGKDTWLIFVDDMTYVIVENLKHYLARNRVDFAGRVVEDASFWESRQRLLDFYAGFVMRLELIKAILPFLSTNPVCFANSKKAPNAIAQCFQSALRIEATDAIDHGKGGHRFLSEGPLQLFARDQSWMDSILRLFSSQDPSKCCSDLAITFGSLSRADFYSMEYLVYHARPMGIDFSLAL